MNFCSHLLLLGVLLRVKLGSELLFLAFGRVELFGSPAGCQIAQLVPAVLPDKPQKNPR